MLEMLSSSSMDTTGKVELLKSAKTDTLPVWGMVGEAGMVVCEAAWVVGLGVEDLAAAEDSDMVAEAVSMLVGLHLIRLHHLLRPTLSLIMRPLVPRRARTFT